MTLQSLFAYIGCCSADVKDQNAEKLFTSEDKPGEINVMQNNYDSGISARQNRSAQRELRSGQQSLNKSTIQISGVQSNIHLVDKGQGKFNLTFVAQSDNKQKSSAKLVMENENHSIEVKLSGKPRSNNLLNNGKLQLIEEEKQNL